KGGAFHEPGATPDAPAPGQSPAARNPPEASGDIGAARASHCVRLQIPGRGDTAAQLRRVTADVISTGRVESAAVYCEAELDASAMALSGLGTTLQFPSNGEAIADGVEQMVAEAAARAMAQIRLPMPIMGVLLLISSGNFVGSACHIHAVRLSRHSASYSTGPVSNQTRSVSIRQVVDKW